MKTILKKMFTPYIDPQSGVVSYLLTKRAAPVQQAFYFVNTGFSPSQRYLWFYAAYPPAGGRVLGVLDFEEGTQQVFPETRFCSESPLVVEEGVYWASDRFLCFRGPRPQDTTELLAKYPDEFFGDRALGHMATHLTFSPDKKELFFDAKVGADFFAGVFNLQTRQFIIWRHFDRYYNHAQFCPTDPDLVLMAQDNQIDPLTGIKTPYDNRLWLLKRNGDFFPVFRDNIRVTHEWWDQDGDHFYALNQMDQLNGPAIIRFNRHDLTWENFLPGKYWHAHDFNHGKWFVADRHPWTDFYRNCPSDVQFIERESAKRMTIISKNPEIKTPGNIYHIDPHPRFSPDGTMITHTATVSGKVDVALTFTEEILARL